MKLARIIILSLAVITAVSIFIYLSVISLIGKRAAPAVAAQQMLAEAALSPEPAAPSRFFSIYAGNQDTVIFAPAYNSQWLQQVNTKYSWEHFDQYSNKFWVYVSGLLDTLPVLAEGKVASRQQYLDSLTKGQKLLYTVVIFNNETDNGGVYQFFFNYPELAFAVTEVFKELQAGVISADYAKCLDEFLRTKNSFAKKTSILNDPAGNPQQKLADFRSAHKDLKTADKIKAYFYQEAYKKQFFKKIVDYVDAHMDQFTQKPHS
ncbi:DMP19 family protein [Chitinophaga agrisoli]|nr:DUF4375 domain-containing protein [Chitinophaga agrisoli]